MNFSLLLFMRESSSCAYIQATTIILGFSVELTWQHLIWKDPLFPKNFLASFLERPAYFGTIIERKETQFYYFK